MWWVDSCDALWLTTDTEHTCVHVTRVRTRPEMSVTVWPTFIVICNPSQTLTLQLPASVVTVTLIIVWFVSIWSIWHPLTGLVTRLLRHSGQIRHSEPSIILLAGAGMTQQLFTVTQQHWATAAGALLLLATTAPQPSPAARGLHCVVVELLVSMQRAKWTVSSQQQSTAINSRSGFYGGDMVRGLDAWQQLDMCDMNMTNHGSTIML